MVRKLHKYHVFPTKLSLAHTSPIIALSSSQAGDDGSFCRFVFLAISPNIPRNSLRTHDVAVFNTSLGLRFQKCFPSNIKSTETAVPGAVILKNPDHDGLSLIPPIFAANNPFNQQSELVLLTKNIVKGRNKEAITEKNSRVSLRRYVSWASLIDSKLLTCPSAKYTRKLQSV